MVQKELSGKTVIVAFSGGVDSSTTALIAKRWAKKIKLVMQLGSSVPESEKLYAQQVADELDLPLVFILYDEVDLSTDYVQNDGKRCYYCKRLLFEKLEHLRRDSGFDLVLGGTNWTDLQGHRPGHKAAQEFQVYDPLVDAQLTKAEVRHIARVHGLQVWDKPANACLASRIMTGVPVSKELLTAIAKAEDFIKSKFGINILRVRVHKDATRIQVSQREIPLLLSMEAFRTITSHLQVLGFSNISLDMEGYRPSGPDPVIE